MTEEYLAHSVKEGCPAQSYRDHVSAVTERAVQYATEAGRYCALGSAQLELVARQSGQLHDLGKLDDENQAVLRNPGGKQRHLPHNHVDAGAAALLSEENLYSALAVYSHHRGLPNMAEEGNRGNALFRDMHPAKRKHVDESLPELLRRHSEVFPLLTVEREQPYDGDLNEFLRLALSCLADADHGDTAFAYGQAPGAEDMPALRAGERLAALDQYVSGLSNDSERGRLRGKMYVACRNAKIEGGFTTCDSPVGSGKTTAVMAHLLKQAQERGLRRIFVVLPYTTIIRQSVRVYRQALTLPGEDANQVVAELHCRADFQDWSTRYLTSLWRAPIVVTTAVAFYETMASCQPASLRRLHELPGSAIFVDEAHNALPLKLLPLAWCWMNTMAEEWRCYWVLASGSLVRYWQLDSLRRAQISMTNPNAAELVPNALRTALANYEQGRICYHWKPEALRLQELVSWVQNAPGPRLLIVNTVQSAAVIAEEFSKNYGRQRVEHLSTALTPEDRETVIQRVSERLDDETDTDWTLVATSCVEAGVDFSFHSGFRELSSLLSLVQAAGRVNRNGKIQGAQMWSFVLAEDSRLKKNPALDVSVRVLREYFEGQLPISPALSTRAMNDEIVRDDSCVKTMAHLLEEEEFRNFQNICREFQVIDADTIPAVVDSALARQITYGKSDWQALQKKSVSIRREKVKAWHLNKIADGVYQWTIGYDNFLGYMRGVLEEERLKCDFLDC